MLCAMLTDFFVSGSFSSFLLAYWLTSSDLPTTLLREFWYDSGPYALSPCRLFLNWNSFLEIMLAFELLY